MLASVRPTLSTVSIIPGMENRAPDRTETSNGFSVPPKTRPVCRSRSRMASVTSAASPSGTDPVFMNSRQTSVVIVKPGGTGSPSRVISAR
jgi:hypothetical protein